MKKRERERETRAAVRRVMNPDGAVDYTRGAQLESGARGARAMKGRVHPGREEGLTFPPPTLCSHHPSTTSSHATSKSSHDASVGLVDVDGISFRLATGGGRRASALAGGGRPAVAGRWAALEVEVDDEAEEGRRRRPLLPPLLPLARPCAGGGFNLAPAFNEARPSVAFARAAATRAGGRSGGGGGGGGGRGREAADRRHQADARAAATTVAAAAAAVAAGGLREAMGGRGATATE